MRQIVISSYSCLIEWQYLPSPTDPCQPCSRPLVASSSRSQVTARCQRYGLSDLGTTVRLCPLAFILGGGDYYSVGYSVAHERGHGPRSDDHLDANYRRGRRPDDLGSESALPAVVHASGCAPPLLYFLL
jgi:hypothetical protein